MTMNNRATGHRIGGRGKINKNSISWYSKITGVFPFVSGGQKRIKSWNSRTDVDLENNGRILDMKRTKKI